MMPGQDTLGTLGRGVVDAALLLDAVAGCDPADNMTLTQPWGRNGDGDGDGPPPIYAIPGVLSASALRRRRLGAFRTDSDAFGGPYFANWPLIKRVFNAALADLEHAGADANANVSAQEIRTPRGLLECIETDPRERKADLDYGFLLGISFVAKVWSDTRTRASKHRSAGGSWSRI